MTYERVLIVQHVQGLGMPTLAYAYTLGLSRPTLGLGRHTLGLGRPRVVHRRFS